MGEFTASVKKSIRKLVSVLDSWGRQNDRYQSTYSYRPYSSPSANPDPIDRESSGDRYFKIVNTPYIKAGLEFRDISRLFISARGLEQSQHGAYFPPQLLYTTTGPENVRLALAEQYDELFDGGFPAILASLQKPAMEYGRAIGEIAWYREGEALRASYIYSRDPQRYLIDPPNKPAGIYQKNHTYSTYDDVTRMPEGKFLKVTFDPLFNNPYGQSLLRPLAELTETWMVCYDSWRMGLVKAGYGSWIGTYDDRIAGEDEYSRTARENLLAAVKEISTKTASIFHQDRNIRAEKLQFEAQAFLDFHTAYVQAVSILLTGSATSLIEGKYGSYAKEEATSIRQKSEKEQHDAALMGSVFTYQFNRFWVTFNYGVGVPIPQLQLIPPGMITPTTPQGQDSYARPGTTDVNVAPQRVETPQKHLKFQREITEEPNDREDFLDYKSFPDETEEPELFRRVEDYAEEWLTRIPVKNYNDVKSNEVANVFTIKRLRNFDGAQKIQAELLSSIVPTVKMRNEKDAWDYYVKQAEDIFRRYGIPFSSSLRSDIIISFRQARQNAYSAGIEALIASKPSGLTGVKTQSMGDKHVRPVHALWNGVILAPEDPRRKKITKPMDFGCRCYDVPIYGTEPLTKNEDIPDVYPGETYRGYVSN